jgi:hypothetical protein
MQHLSLLSLKKLGESEEVLRENGRSTAEIFRGPENRPGEELFV